MANKNKATHYGECQVCGHTQKLPGQTLAKHGYTKRWGFFSGTCTGSHGNPLETHHDLIDKSIQDAQATVARLEALAAEALQPITGSLVWVNVYVPATWEHRKSYKVWRQVELIDGRYYADENGHQTRNGVKVSGLGYYGDNPAQQSHTARANDLSRQAAQVQEYIAWQTKRLATWAPKDLRPVSGAVVA